MDKISVVINTYNAEKHLRAVLGSVSGFDEIVICDMYSRDRTVEIAKEFNCRIIYHKHTDIVEPARMFAIEAAQYDWVLVLDADEVVPPTLKKHLYDLAKHPDCPDGLEIPRRNYFMGRSMRCFYPDYVLRFFRKNLIDWPPYIHAKPSIKGIVRSIPKKKRELAFIHLANDTVATHIAKINLYSDKEIIKRRNKKYNYFSLLNETVFRFFKFYLFKGAIRDGKAGLIYAGLLAFYKYATIAKIWENQYRKEIPYPPSR